MELGRLAEYALLPGNGLDYQAVLAGYGELVPVDSPAFWIYRLDAAVMLALLFNSQASSAGPGQRALDRLRDVHLRLGRELSKISSTVTDLADTRIRTGVNARAGKK